MADVNVKVKLEPLDGTNSDSANMIGASPSSVRVSWTHGTGNVIQTLLNRQLGLPFFSRSGESVCSNLNEKRIGRQLISKRSKCVEGHGEKAVRPVKVKFEQTEEEARHIQTSTVTTDWVQLELSVPNKTKVGLVNGKLWKRYNEGQAGPNAKFKEEFYALDVYDFGLQLLSCSSSIGKMRSNFTLTPRPLSTALTSTYLITLTEPCYLRAYDMMQRRVSNELKLNLNVTVPPLKQYNELDICESTEKILVYGTTGGQLVKAVVIFDYPPNWSKVVIVYIDQPKLKLRVIDGSCLILQNKRMHLTTWPLLMEKVEIISPTGKSPEASLAVKFEGRLCEMPTLLNSIPLKTEKPPTLLMNTVVPLIFANAKSGMKFFLPVHLNHLIPSPSVYEFHKIIADQEVTVCRFSDSSDRSLIFTECNQYEFFKYEVVTFKFELSKAGKVVKPCVSHPFNYWDELQTSVKSDPPATTTSRSSSRPSRTCAIQTNKALNFLQKKSILGMTYCKSVDLLAVLMADLEACMVILYNPFDLSVFKALPPVRIWPAEKNGDPNAKRVSIQNVQFGFEPSFIFIEFGYSSECKPPKEFFCFRLLSESVN